MCLTLQAVRVTQNKSVQGIWVHCWRADWASGGCSRGVRVFFTFLLSQHSGRSYCSRVCFNVTARARIGMTHTGSYNRGVNHTLSVCVCGHMSAPHQLRRCEQRTAEFYLLPFIMLQWFMNHKWRESLIVLSCWWPGDWCMRDIMTHFLCLLLTVWHFLSGGH